MVEDMVTGTKGLAVVADTEAGSREQPRKIRQMENTLYWRRTLQKQGPKGEPPMRGRSARSHFLQIRGMGGQVMRAFTWAVAITAK